MTARQSNTDPLRCFLAAASLVILLVSASSAASTLKVLYSFKGGTDGNYPYDQLFLDPAGNLYGVTAAGGSTTQCYGEGCGTVFELMTRNGHWTEIELYSFPASSNSSSPNPTGPLVRDSSGNLYGTTMHGGDPSCDCGEVYQLTRSAGVWTQSTIHNFVGGANDGQYVQPGLVQDSAGNLYGMTDAGGNIQNGCSGCGTVFELTRNSDGTWTENLIYQFTNGRDGANPYGPMAIDAAGNLYGTTVSAGVYGWGTVFKLTPSNGTWTETTLFDFTVSDGGNGGNQTSGLALDAAGNLFAASPYGGVNQVGIVYELTPTTGYWNYSTVHTFTGGGDGGYPYAGLSVDKAGNLYGATIYGGTFEYGTVYKLARGKSGRWNETVLHSFTNGSDGSLPYGVILDSSGNLYGTASEGGANSHGVVFEITP
jgi:uncharacterized repeat protein (TIGR03803 family)